MDLKADALPTSIGSFPHTDPGAALRLIARRLPEIPGWPQLPRLGYRENMYVQYLHKAPAARIDPEREVLYFDTSADSSREMEIFYENVLAGNADPFALEPEYALGFGAFLDALGRDFDAGRIVAVKGQVTGPVSLGLTVTDQNRRSILYNETFFDVVLKACRMGAAWQVERLKDLCDRVILFIDEPYLVSFGSAFAQFSSENATAWIDEVAGEIHARGGIAGAHCCGNTEWPIILNSRVDILSLDASAYFEGLTLYPGELKAFHERGGVLAFGIVPASEDAPGLTADALTGDLLGKTDKLSNVADASALLRRSLITPSCGLGTVSEQAAEAALRLCREISDRIRGDYLLS